MLLADAERLETGPKTSGPKLSHALHMGFVDICVMASSHFRTGRQPGSDRAIVAPWARTSSGACPLTAYSLVRPLLYKFDAEKMHNLALHGLAAASRCEPATTALARLYQYDDPRLAGRRASAKPSPIPIGIAAGLDKNGVGVPALLALGFGFVEIGTVTPVSQPGNPKPRVFRLPEDGGVINRMGFPGAGVEQVAANLERYRDRLGNLGVNIGPNKTSVANGTADDDCVAVLQRLHHLAAYLVVNVSSPNTAELRKLQGKEALRHLLERVIAARPAVNPKPILVKISPDMTDRELDDVLEVDQRRRSGRHRRDEHNRQPALNPQGPASERRRRAERPPVAITLS